MSRVLILGGDGYLGWSTAMSLAAKGHEVSVVDSYLRRKIAKQTDSEALMVNPDLQERANIFRSITNISIEVFIGDLCDMELMQRVFTASTPDSIIHYAEQPSAPYSMRDYASARLTLDNNLTTTFNLIWAVIEHNPDCHIIKLGTMGEYGTPNIDIEEGWIEINHKGRSDKFLFPRAAGSLYHTTKVLDTDLLWFYVRTYGLRVTDLMQGPVYGITTRESSMDDRLLPNFHYDDIFGTVINRFLVQAISDVPLTVYGKGGQTRGYLNLIDTLQCLELAVANRVNAGELRILNQVAETFTVNELAAKIKNVGDRMGHRVQINHLPNPRKEMEDHYYNPVHTGLIDLGLSPTYLSDDIIAAMLEKINIYRNRIDPDKIMPRVNWN